MSITQKQIDELLATLQSLHEQIAPLREQATTLETELHQIQRLYERKLGTLHEEARRLKERKSLLRMRLARSAQPVQPSDTEVPVYEEQAEPPPETLPDEWSEPGVVIPQPIEDLRATRKRTLADHIYNFVDNDQVSVVMQTINALLADEQYDVGDMLETLEWGPLWRARPDWETLEEQYTRLDSWRLALEERISFWQGKIRRIEQDSMYELWSNSHQINQGDVTVLLDELVQKQVQENERLAHEVAVLEKQWQKKQTAS